MNYKLTKWELEFGYRKRLIRAVVVTYERKRNASGKVKRLKPTAECILECGHRYQVAVSQNLKMTTYRNCYECGKVKE